MPEIKNKATGEIQDLSAAKIKRIKADKYLSKLYIYPEKIEVVKDPPEVKEVKKKAKAKAKADKIAADKAALEEPEQSVSESQD